MAGVQEGTVNVDGVQEGTTVNVDGVQENRCGSGVQYGRCVRSARR